jgi:hypothetical protein
MFIRLNTNFVVPTPQQAQFHQLFIPPEITGTLTESSSHTNADKTPYFYDGLEPKIHYS